jgi:hypothetical protein
MKHTLTPAALPLTSLKEKRSMKNGHSWRTRTASPALETLSRRDFIRVAGGTVIAASVGGLGLLRPRPVEAATTQRPLSDYLDAQKGEFSFFPEAANRWGRIDYNGVATASLASLGISLGTTFSGTVTERPLADGRAEVTVLLQTENAFAVAREFSSAGSGPALFGFTLTEIAADPVHNRPAVGDSSAHFVFDNTAPGAPLPDLEAAFLVPGAAPPGFELVMVAFQGRATGPLRSTFGVTEGTPGEMVISQTALIATSGIANPNSRVGIAGAVVDLHVIG